MSFCTGISLPLTGHKIACDLPALGYIDFIVK